jgi:nucleotide-binding universal stress UspA family protein
MTESILIATDGSEAAQAAERYGVALAAKLGARVVGVTVIEERWLQTLRADSLGVAQPPIEPIEAFLKARAEAASRRLADLARSQRVDCTTDTLRGVADDRIAERAQGVDLLVLGRDGLSASSRSGLIGSTVDGVLRKTTKPTIVVPRGAEFGGGVVLGFDGSPGSRIAAKIAIDLARKLGHGLHVFVDSKDKGRAASRFDEMRRLLSTSDVQVREASSTLGRPDVKIVDTARSSGAGLIVIGAFGRNRISEYFIGSNAASIVRTSPVAVLLAR